MALNLLSSSPLSQTKTLTLFNPPSLHLSKNHNSLPVFPPKPQSSPKFYPISASLSTPTTLSTDADLQESNPPKNPPSWPQFAGRISGEWDGFAADFTAAGTPIELPYSVVPDAFRDWGVDLFDWQTQCPTLAVESDGPALSYKLIKLLPTVGCEADAATRHSVEDRVAGGPESRVSAFGFDSSGCYAAVWPVEGFGGKRGLELEHCLVDPRNGEIRVRVVQLVGMEGEAELRLESVRVFSEQWYGPWRNGEQLGGCAIRESGFATSEKVEVSEVVGVWEEKRVGVARIGSEGKDVFYEFMVGKPQRSGRDQVGLVTLPKNLWCSVKEKEDGETWAEVGWLLDHGYAITSRCGFHKDGKLKEMSIGQETAVLEEM